MSFSSDDGRLLQLIVATFVETDEQHPRYPIADIAAEILALLEEKSPEERSEFQQLLQLFHSPFLGFTYGGAFRSFDQLNKTERERVFQSWSQSRFAKLRKGYQALKKLSSFISYSYRDDAGTLLSANITQYHDLDVSDSPKNQQIPFQKLSNHIHCEVLIIGSGAGAGVAAARFAKAGKEVLIVEKAAWMPFSEMNGREAEMVSQQYEERGALTNVDGSMTIFAGATLGGGTSINWQACFKTPDYILEEWSEKSGIQAFTSKAYQESQDYVWERIGAGKEAIIHNRNNQLLIQGSKALHQTVNDIAKNSSHCNADGAESCGWCGFGCRKGSKQSSLVTFLQDAFDQGARVLDRCYIERLTFSGNAVNGAEGIHTDAQGKQTFVKISAEKVIVAAGSIHSPALLMRSGIRHPQLGKNLYLHPVVPVPALYKDEVKAWSGAMMTSTNDEHIQLEGRYGYKIETPPPHSGLLALGMPWNSPQVFEEKMKSIRNMGVFIVLTRDEFTGRIALSKDGRPQIHYQLHVKDQKRLMHGMMNAARIHAAAGAQEIALPHVRPTFLSPEIVQDERAFQQAVDALRWKKGDFTLFSAHQMGTCRMGTNYSESVVRPDGQVWNVPGLYVMDASVFPVCSGVNPMVSILAVVDWMCRQQGL